MSDQKPREFWVEQYNGLRPPKLCVFIERPRLNAGQVIVDGGEPIPAFEYFQVIERKAFAAVSAELATARQERDSLALKLERHVDELGKARQSLDDTDKLWGSACARLKQSDAELTFTREKLARALQMADDNIEHCNCFIGMNETKLCDGHRALAELNEGEG